MRVTRSSLLCACTLLTFAACGGPQGGAKNAGSETEVACPAPIGTIARENCAEIAEDFGALNVDGALKLAASSKGAEERIEAIKAAGELATTLKDRRVALCGEYNACKMTVAEHNAEDDRLAKLMASLIKSWDERKFLDPDGAKQLRDQVAQLSASLDGMPVEGTSIVAAETKPASVRVLGDKLTKVQGAGITFSAASGAVSFTATGDGKRDAVTASLADLQAKSGSRYLMHVSGNYTPSTPSLIKAGDDIVVRFKYRTSGTGEVSVALRSLEDPDALDSTSKLPITKAGAGDQQVTLTAPPGSSGFYVGIVFKGEGSIEFDDVELVRGGSVIASAAAESGTEAHLESTCNIQKTKPISGKASFACQSGTKDLLTIGRPRSYLFIAARKSPGDDASILNTASLEGGRSIDATFTDTTSLVIGIVGSGSATIQAVDVKKL